MASACIFCVTFSYLSFLVLAQKTDVAASQVIGQKPKIGTRLLGTGVVE